eukprot:g5550.t1
MVCRIQLMLSSAVLVLSAHAAVTKVPLPASCEHLHRGPDASGGPWKITVVEGPPFVIVRDPTDPDKPYRDTSQWKGFTIDLIEEMASHCHFQYDLRLPDQGNT